MTELSVQVDPGDIAKVKLMVGALGKASGKVIQQSVNRTLTGVRTDSTNEVAKVITPTKKAIRSSMTINKMTAKDGRASVDCKGKPLNLIHFKARQTNKGVTIQVLKKSGRKLVPHAFKTKLLNELVAIRMYKGHRRPWKRTFPYGKLPKDYRFPGGHLKFLTTLAIPDVMGHDPTMNKIIRLADVRLKKNLNTRLNYEIGKLR